VCARALLARAHTSLGLESPCTAGKRRPLDAVRDELEKDPEAIAGYVMKAINEGRDVRALTSILDHVSTASQRVEEPNSLDELAKPSREQRHTLMRQLEEAGRADPFRAS
jgi:DNA-binding phage protein